MKTLLSLTVLTSLIMGQFTAPLATATPTSAESPTAMLTETPVAVTPTSEVTIVPSETAVPVTETPTESETPTAISSAETPTETPITETTTPVITSTVTETPVPTITTVSSSLSLSANPGFITPGGNLILNWVIEGISLEDRTLVLQIILPANFSLQGNNDGIFDETSHTLTIPVTTLSGQIHLKGGNSTNESLIEAILLEGMETLTSASLIVPTHEKFVLDKKGGTIEAMGGKIKIKFPKDVFSEKTVIDVGPPSGESVPDYSLSGQPFEIKAHDEQSKTELKEFSKELTISVSYADLELPATLEGDLHLYWYNPETKDWEGLPSRVDKETKTLIAYTDHFTVFDMDVNNWQASHLPTVDSFQVSSFTGAATYSLPIEVPPGPGGFQPSLSLNYNSQIVDQSTLQTQASWAGMGWSLETGSIEIDTHGTGNSSTDDTLLLNVAGVSTRLVRIADGVYRATDENFWKINYSDGTWVVKDKQGNTYTFGKALNYPFEEDSCDDAWMTHRWMLTKVTNVFGQEINYTYADQTKQIQFWSDCIWNWATATTATYPSTITYANGRYRISFDRGSDLVRNRQDYPSAWDTDLLFHSFEKYRLENIYVKQDANGDGIFDTVIRRYEFKYKGNSESDIIFPGYQWTANGKTTTLKSVQQYGVGGNGTPLPATTFTYGDNLHLTRADNGYGGAVEFDYESWYYAPSARPSQSIQVRFGDYGKFPCFDGVESPWGARKENEEEIGRVECESEEPSPLIIRGESGVTKVIATAGDIRNEINSDYTNHSKDLVRPGGIYKLTASMGFSGSEGRLGLFDGSGDDTFSLSGDPSSIIRLPANASKAEPVIEVSGLSGSDYAAVSTFNFQLLTSIYRVKEKRVKDGAGHSYPFTYSYNWTAGTDSAAVNKDYPVRPETGTCSNAETFCPEYFERYSEFRGHGLVTETGPDGKITVTRFLQDETFKGRPSWVTISDSSSLRSKVLYSYTAEPWSFAAVGVPECVLCSPYIGLSRNFIYADSVENRVYDNNGTSYNATKTTYTYDNYGNLLTQTEAEKDGPDWVSYRTTITTYKPNNTTDTYLVSLPARQLVRQGDETGSIQAATIYLYDGNTGSYNTEPSIGKLTAVRTWVDGNFTTGRYSQVTYGYDSYGNRIKETTYEDYTDGDGPSPTDAHTTYTCYGGGVAVGGEDCPDDGYHAYPLWAKTPKGHKTHWTYDYSFGVPLTETDPNGAVTRAEYDSFGRIKNIYRPNPITGSAGTTPSLTIAYQDANPFTTTLTQKIDGTQFYTVQRVYDGMGRQKKIISGGSTVDTIYQSATVTKQSLPYFDGEPVYYTTTTVNPAAQMTTVTAPDGTSTITTTNGLVTTFTDAHGNLTTTTKDVWGRVVSVEPPTGPSVIYTYDEFDRLKTATRGDVTTITTLTYDHIGRKLTMSDPDMGNWTYAYDALGNLTMQKDARGQRICLYYDALNRLKGKHYRTDDNCPATPTYNVSYGYDSGTNGVGRRTSMSSTFNGQTITNSWTYDARGRVLSETVNPGTAYTTNWTYYAADLPASMTYPDGEVVAYDYNARMLLEKLRDTKGTSSDLSDDYYYVSSTFYDSAGRIDLRTLGNNLTQNYDYYAWIGKATVDGQLVGQGGRLKRMNVGALQNLSYLYDAVGNIRTINDSITSETQSFNYDALNRLISANVVNGPAPYNESYSYDADGNLDVKAGVDLNYNDPAHKHAVTHIGSTQKYWYDANGNQTTRIIGADTYDLKYDAENRLVEVKKNNSLIATFVYDGDGKRVKSVMGGETILFVGGHYEIKNPGGGQEVTKYYFVGASPIAVRKYIIPQSQELTYLLGDHLGSTSLATDDTGNLLVETRYKAWGEVRYTTPNETLPTRYTYTGQYSYMNDEATDFGSAGFGLMFYNARWYDPTLGRFSQPDMLIPPTQGVQAWDRYAYSNNNPVKYTDPSGHFIETAWDFAMIGVDMIDIAQNGLNWSNGAALAVDVASAIIPGIPAVGGALLKTAKAVNAVDNAIDAANAVDNAVDTANAIDNAMDAGNAVDNAADAINTVDDTDTLITRTYTFGDESFEYRFNPQKPTALGYSEDVANLSLDEYNVLRGVPKDVYDNTSIQRDLMRDIINSRIKPKYFSNKNTYKTRVFSRYESRLLDRFERMFGKWYE